MLDMMWGGGRRTSAGRLAATTLLLAALAVSGGGGARPPPPVEVSKCCRVGDALEADGRGCRAGGGSELWAPLVYAPQRRAYLPRGTVPAHWRVREARRPACAAPRLVRAEPANGFLLFANGSLFLQERAVALPPSAYCADAGAALLCDADAPALLLRKCCAESAAYRYLPSGEGSCSEGGGGGARLLGALREAGGGAAVGYGFPPCENGTYAEVGPLAGARLLAGGALQLGGTRLPADAYCAEWAWGRPDDALVLVCHALVAAAAEAAEGGGGGRQGRDLRFVLYPVGLLVSAAFLAATLAAGFALPSSYRALHWRCQTHYVASLLVGYVLLAATQLASDIERSACVALAVMMHFLFLSAFFWLNTMCFNVWWTFRDFRPTSAEKSQERCRLRVYQVYAWGGPFLISCVAFVLDQLPEDPGYTFLRPRFGEHSCWFYGDTEILTYFFGPVGVLLCVNLALFLSTARQLTCGVWRRDEVKSTTERASLSHLCAKLVVVMGVTWAADVISWAAGGPQELWYITDLINTLQGVFIFIVVGCTPQVWAAVKRAWCVRRLRGELGPRGAAVEPLHSSQVPSCGEFDTHNTLTTSQPPAASSAASAATPAPPPPAHLPRETVC